MGSISAGTGLMSGLDIAGIVKQLMEIESKPLTLLKQRITTIQTQQTAYADVKTLLLAAKTSLGSLAQVALFNKRTAASSNTNVLNATAANGTATGTTSFTVRSLVSTHQIVSGGYSGLDALVGAGRLVFEDALANIAPSTQLSSLNGGNGIRRGSIRIIDRSGGVADVSLGGAVTVDDVVETINSQSKVSVRASVEGGRLVIQDLSGGTANDLRVLDLSGGYAAFDLGIAGSSSTGRLEGRDLVSLTTSTQLNRLNDGIGVRYNRNSSDFRFTLANGGSFDVSLSTNLTYQTNLAQLNNGQGVRTGVIRITNRTGESAEVDLTGAQTVQDVKDRIDQANIGVTLNSLKVSGLVLTDTTGQTGSNLKIEDVSGYAAADLGIAADVSESSITGSAIFRMDTLGAVVQAINYASGNNGQLTVALSGAGLVFTDTTTGGSTTSVTALNGSMAARDLGLLGQFDSSGQLQTRNLMAGLNTVLLSSLKGGSGLAGGTLSFTLRDGTTLDGLDFSQAQSLSEIISGINATGKVSAEVDAGGTRIRLRDLTTGTGTFSAGGEMAARLGLTSSQDGRLLSDDLQLQYVGEGTLLSRLNGGKGITYGSFNITTASGVTRSVTISQLTHATIGNVIESINNLGIGVIARINADGDGIELQDTTTGAGHLAVSEAGTGKTASSLGLDGTGDESGVLTGSFARTIQVNASDSLQTLIANINSSGAGVIASTINDGSPDTPYRLVLTSRTSGTQGQVSFSSDIPGLTMDTLSRARDAAVLVGSADSSNSILVTGSSNTIKDLIPGLTISLVSTSDSPVQVTVGRDADSIVNTVTEFITAFNGIMDKIDELTKYDTNTEQKGTLFGASTIRQVQSRLFSIVSSSVSGAGVSFKYLSDLGIMVDSSSGSARLTMSRTMSNGTVIDGEKKLRDAIESDPESVKKLFSLVEVSRDNKPVYVGIAARLNQELTSMTIFGGLLYNEDQQLQTKVDQFNTSAARMQVLLNGKESRLYAQFRAMENALADMQSQQTALTTLANLASQMSS